MLVASVLYHLARMLWDALHPVHVPPTPPAPPVVTPAPTPITPTPTPAPVVVPPAPSPVPPIAPTPVPTITRRFGPFQNIGITDVGVNGYRVSGDGRNIGTFQIPGRTEDAGLAGHYFVMTEYLR
jgi:hypothetical protein